MGSAAPASGEAPSGGRGFGHAGSGGEGGSVALEVGGGWRHADFEEGVWLLPKMEGKLPFIGGARVRRGLGRFGASDRHRRAPDRRRV